MKAFKIDVASFYERFPPLQSTIIKWNPRKKTERYTFLEKFSIENWQKLSEIKKRGHTSNCKGCHLDFSHIQALFPVKSPRLKGKENPCLVAKSLSTKIKRLCKGAIKGVTNDIYNKLNTSFEEWAGVSFAEALCKVPEAKVEGKKTTLQKKQ